MLQFFDLGLGIAYLFLLFFKGEAVFLEVGEDFIKAAPTSPLTTSPS